VALVAVACGGAVVLAILLTRPADERPGVEARLRTLLTRPGPEQIAPGGEHPSSIHCQKSGNRRWSCLVRYRSGIRLQCLVGERKGEEGPICESPQGRLPLRERGETG
jgi:hypothetical protein